MKRYLLLANLAVLTLANLAPHGRAQDLPIDRGLGTSVADFMLKDTAGKTVRLSDFKDKKAVALVFVATGCPVNDLYLPRLGELAKVYEPKGVALVAVASGRGEDAEKLTKHLASHGAALPALMDVGNVVADALKVERTCETLVMDANQRLRYRGAIDDQYARDGRKDKPTRQYLVDALDAVLAGREVLVKATSVAGCPIERAQVQARKPRGGFPADIVKEIEAFEKPVKVGQVNYTADVAVIIQNKCQVCHRPGESGPFSLLTYDDARRRSAAIREVVSDRVMPPWHADPRHGKFANDRRLSPKELATLVAWVDQDCPLGDPKQMPAPKVFPEGWLIGAPDVILEMREPFVVKAQGILPYQNITIPTNFKEDKWVQAVEIRPGERGVVHHIAVSVVPKGGLLGMLMGGGGLENFGDFLATYLPGYSHCVFPEGTGKFVPAGSELSLQVHYTPIGREMSDRTRIGLIFAKTPPTRKVKNVNIAQIKIAIPPNDPNYKLTSQYTFKVDAPLLALSPHMHLRGKDFKFTATYPDGKSEVLLSVPAYDFAWQTKYYLAEPKIMPRGTRIHCLAHFDNSAGNQANPDPTKLVRFGFQSWDEMMVGVLDIVVDVPKK